MSAEPERYKFTPEEYLAFERQSLERHEYLDGDIFAMVGASKRHRKIQASILAYLFPDLLKRDCWIYANDSRIRPKGSKAYFYPDLVIQCDEEEYEDQSADTVVNPTVIFEILSPSTKSYDRGAKFVQYRAIPSLQSYVLVSQDTPLIEYHDRNGDAWVYRRIEGLESVLDLTSVGCTLPLSVVYQGIDFAEDQE